MTEQKGAQQTVDDGAGNQLSTTAGQVYPRVTIQFCTQCKWMLRAAYFAQELLSTFNTALGEVALQPSTGGTFVVTIHHQQQQASAEATPAPSPSLLSTVLWDRKVDGGFPETKELKRRVRDVIEPGRNLGHVDRDHARPAAASSATTPSISVAAAAEPDGQAKTDQPAATSDGKAECADCA